MPTTAQTTKTVGEHIGELRGRLWWYMVSLVVAVGVSYYFHDILLDILLRPFNAPLYYTTPGGGFAFLIKLSVFTGLLVSTPVALYQLVKFIEPAMPRRSTTVVVMTVVVSTLLLAAGVSFAYFISLPAALHFLNSYSTDQIQSLVSTDSYFTFVLTYLVGFGLLFQLPLILMLVNIATPLRVRTLMRHQRWVILGSAVLAAVLTPTPDPINQGMMAAPIIALYQVAMVPIWLVNLGRRDAKGDMVLPAVQGRPAVLRPELLAGMRLTEMQHARRGERDGMMCLWEANEPKRGPAKSAMTFLYQGRHEVLRTFVE